MEYIITILATFAWAVVDYKAAEYLMEKHPDFEVDPGLYAIGAILMGGLWPLLWLIGKFLLWSRKGK